MAGVKTQSFTKASKDQTKFTVCHMLHAMSKKSEIDSANVIEVEAEPQVDAVEVAKVATMLDTIGQKTQ